MLKTVERMNARHVAKAIGPQVVGGRYLSGYWQQEYTVTAIDILGGTWWMTCLWADGRTTRHCTAWDARRDRVLA